MFIANDWLDYKILDAGQGEKLENWGNITTIRPDPQVIWERNNPKIWQNYHMHYHRSKSGGGSWQTAKQAPSHWKINYNNLTFSIKPTDFKHMGLFPEQASNWNWLMNTIKLHKKPVRILNLFGYTGGATVACISAGAKVTHVDAAKGMNQWAKENIRLSSLHEMPYRIFTDDVHKFVKREQRRESFYEGIILDPPSYGRGPSGEIWKLEERLYNLIENCIALLSENPLFVLLNTYTTGFTAIAAENVLKMAVAKAGKKISQAAINSGTLALPIANSNLILPCGNSVRWTIQKS
ncbi:MAG: class I SAM-dependent methyltransferase [Firmicutes bacterium]|nr:class I SAM-dependent methyltransferase [Bacillota bacterium]